MNWAVDVLVVGCKSKVGVNSQVMAEVEVVQSETIWGVEEFSSVHIDYRKVYLVLPRDVESEVRQDQAEDKNLRIIIIEMELQVPEWMQSLGSKRGRREWGVRIPGERTFH